MGGARHPALRRLRRAALRGRARTPAAAGCRCSSAPRRSSRSGEQILAERAARRPAGRGAVPRGVAPVARLAHRPGPGNEDARAFHDWVAGLPAKNRRRGRRRAPARSSVADFLEEAEALVAYAFDIVPPQTKEFLARFALEECQPGIAAGKSAVRCSLSPPAKEEIEAAARWASARLEEGKRRASASSSRTSRSGGGKWRASSRASCSPATTCPARRARRCRSTFRSACRWTTTRWSAPRSILLELSLGGIAFERASRLVRSPFLGGAESERARRAALDVWLRRKLDATVSLPKLIAAAERAPLLRRFWRKSSRCAAKSGAGTDAVGMGAPLLGAARRRRLPGRAGARLRRIPDARQVARGAGGAFQARAGCEGMSPRECLAVLRRLCADTLFQPESRRRAGPGARRPRVGRRCASTACG